MKNIYDILGELKINYEKHEHPAVFTVEEAEKYDTGNAVHSKNLFLRNKKGNKYYLVIMEAEKKLDFKKLALLIKENKLSFASTDDLMKYLGLTTGSVSPFGLINDTNQEVQVIVDEDLLKQEKQQFHPNINTATLIISTSDFRKFLDSINNKILYLTF